jgi:hypothetical protein
MLLIAQESLDLDRVQEFRWSGTYAGGKLLTDFLGSSPFPMDEHSEAGVAKLVEEYLVSANDRVVVVGQLGHCRSKLLHWRTEGMRFGFFGDEAYPILSRCDTGCLEVMADAIRLGHWSTGLFSKSSSLSAASSEDIELVESCLDEIAANAVHVFTAALDGEGYLVWSIGKESDQRLISDFLEAENRRNLR